MEEFETRVMQEELIKLEKERDQKEKEATRRIIEFNFKVSEEAEKLDQTVKGELNGLREALDREREERAIED